MLLFKQNEWQLLLLFLDMKHNFDFFCNYWHVCMYLCTKPRMLIYWYIQLYYKTNTKTNELYWRIRFRNFKVNKTLARCLYCNQWMLSTYIQMETNKYYSINFICLYPWCKSMCRLFTHITFPDIKKCTQKAWKNE